MIRPYHIHNLLRRSFSSKTMYKQTATDLTKIPEEKVRTWLNSFDTVLTDCDGVVWVHNTVIDGSNKTVNRLKELGKKVFFATNNSTKTRDEFVEKAKFLDFNIQKDDIISTAYLSAKYLANLNFSKKVYVIGSTGIGQELDNFGIKHTGIGPDVMTTSYADARKGFDIDPEIGAVIVGFDEHISFMKLLKAATYLDQPGCLFIATNTDERFPVPNSCVIPGTGTFVRAVETCALRSALVMGKPSPEFCSDVVQRYGLKPERTLMIGDRCNTDILLGTNCGFQTLLVGTGIHTLNDVKEWQSNDSSEDKKLIPDLYLPKLGDLLKYLN